MARSRPPRSRRHAGGAAGGWRGPLVGSALLLLAGRTPPAAACPAPPEFRPALSPPIVAPRSAAQRPLRIVALGSSSTQGTPLDRPESLWPARLEGLLRDRLGDRRVTVVNRGVGGETAADNLARLDRDAIAPAPDLVVWQVGSNDALGGLDPAVARTVGQGIRRLRAAGIGVVLMDGQWLPAEGPDAAMRAMSAALAEAAATEGVALFPRHRLMQALVERGLARPEDLVGPDGLHMTATAHACLAERLADLLAPPPGPPSAE